MASVIVYEIKGNGRSHSVCDAMADGIRKLGDQVTRSFEQHYRGVQDYDVAVFYGMAGNLRRVMADYKRAGKQAVYLDLGFWGRRDGGRRHGYHKITVNDRHPNAYFQKRAHSSDRFLKFGIPLQPWRKTGKYVLVAGISAKGSRFEGWEPMAWERKAIAELQKFSKRQIVYRPKPSCPMAQPIAGVGYSGKEQLLEDVLRDAYAVVAHHSNVLVDGLLAGVPAFCADGVALAMGSSKLGSIESPRYPDGREQWAADVAYTQWKVAEMADGLPWRHFKDEGLIP